MNDTQNRIIDTPDDVYFNPLELTEGSDWSDPEDALNDLTQGNPPASISNALYFSFWEGEGDADDFASLRVQKDMTATWADYFNSACDFSSTPNEGATVYWLCGIVKNA